MTSKIHAICLALNEEHFLAEQLELLYPFCSGISVITQYDRDYYDQRVRPDRTVPRVLEHPDPEGKIALVVRRWRDETVARNHEMLSVLARPHRKVDPHGTTMDVLRRRHAPPDYFLIVDADDFFDVDRIEGVLDHLEATRPRAMRMHFRNYIGTWNAVLPPEEAPTCSFVFVRAGILFQRWRILSRREFAWNGFRYNTPRRWWSRRQRILAASGLSHLVERAHGFTVCPPEVGVMHHAQWIGGARRIEDKLRKSGNQSHNDPRFREVLRTLPKTFVPTEELPRNIREGSWPADFWENPEDSQGRGASSAQSSS